MRSARHSFSWQQVAAFRLRRHHLLEYNQPDLVRVCSDICGVQASWPLHELPLWARLPTVKRENIHSALWRRRSLVKTTLMRQTLHWIPAQEFSSYIAALRSSRIAALLKIRANFGVTSNSPYHCGASAQPF
jgi:hypothetical protein